MVLKGGHDMVSRDVERQVSDGWVVLTLILVSGFLILGGFIAGLASQAIFL